MGVDECDSSTDPVSRLKKQAPRRLNERVVVDFNPSFVLLSSLRKKSLTNTVSENTPLSGRRAMQMADLNVSRDNN